MPSRAWGGGSTRRWRDFRARMLQRHPLCQVCGDGVAVELHHRVPLAAGGRLLDPDNVTACCARCHRREHGAHLGDVGPDGWPLSPHHHWNKPA